MRAARRAAAPSSDLVTWGWFAVLPVASVLIGGSAAGLIPRESMRRVFWAAWWREGDPRGNPAELPDPDAYGFLEGSASAVFGEAIGAADSAIRKAKGRPVFATSIGELWARRAYREGAPQVRSSSTDFGSIATRWLAEHRLTDDATPAAVKDAYRQASKTVHPDKGGSAEAFVELTKGYEAALAVATARDGTRVRSEIAAGNIPPRYRRVCQPPPPDMDQGFLAPLGPPLDLNRKQLLDEIRRVALAVRRRAEEIAPHLDIPSNLEGFCMVASLGLVEALRQRGLSARIAGGKVKKLGHYWAEVALDDSSILVDITATQFGSGTRWPRVLVLPPEKLRRDYERIAGGAYVAIFASQHCQELLAQTPKLWWAS